MVQYTDKVIVITGAGSGIGRQLAIDYAKRNATVVMIDKNTQNLQETKQSISPGHAHVLTVDLADAAAIPKAFQYIHKQFGRVDVLINNAGMGKTISPFELKIEDWDEVLNTNLRATFLCSREAALLMKKHGGGSIVNIASTRAFMSEPDTEAYAASKGGIIALTHAMAISFGPAHIRVNAISPGWIETGEYDALRAEDHLQHPSGRVGQPTDITKACFYLTDPENDFVTGSNLTVDGGMTRKMIYKD